MSSLGVCVSRRLLTLVVLGVLCSMLGCDDGNDSSEGAVYALSNTLRNNEVVVFRRSSDGRLSLMQRIATGGGGSGVQLDPTDSLGSQGALVLNRAHTLLFAVNTESLAEDQRSGTDIGDCQTGTISSFRVADDGRLSLVERVPSGGLFPASLTVNGQVLFVLNAGGPGRNPVCGIGPNITGFTVADDGRLTPITNATQPINPGSSPGTFLNCDPGNPPFSTDEFQCGLNPPAFPRSPAQIGFSPNGTSLVVTVKGTNRIYVFPVGQDGRPGTPTITQASGPNQPTPFGFAFDNLGNLIVTEPFGVTATIPAAPFSAVSSYAIRANGSLQTISASVPSGRGTACWIALDPEARYAYIGNNATSDISLYGVGANGGLTLLSAQAASAELPNDLATVRAGDRSFLYVLESGNGTVGAFQINADGSLTALGAQAGLPVDAGAQGLAAY